MEGHIFHVRQVLARLLKNKLFMVVEKCAFLVDNASFLGYIIWQGSVQADQEKIRALEEGPIQKASKELQQLL